MSEPYPHYPARHRRPLDGIWDFAWAGADLPIDAIQPQRLAYDDVRAVPGVFDTDLKRRQARGVGVYRRQVDCGPGRMRRWPAPTPDASRRRTSS